MGTHRASMSRRPDASAPAADTASSSPTSPPAEKRDRRRRARKASTPDHLRKTPESTPEARGSPPTPRSCQKARNPQRGRKALKRGPVSRPGPGSDPRRTQKGPRRSKQPETAGSARKRAAGRPQEPGLTRPTTHTPRQIGTRSPANRSGSLRPHWRGSTRPPRRTTAAGSGSPRPQGPDRARPAGRKQLATSPAAEQRDRRRRARKATDRHQHTGRQPSRVWIPANEQQCSSATRSQPRQPTPPADRPGEAPPHEGSHVEQPRQLGGSGATHTGQRRPKGGRPRPFPSRQPVLRPNDGPRPSPWLEA